MSRQITDDDIGLKVLCEPPSTATQIVDIIAIHGIGAHPDDTWCKNVGTPESPQWLNWLSEANMLPAIAVQARIMRYGYQSAWFGRDATRQKASILAERLLRALQRKAETFRPLVFIAHCFGGLVVLKALLEAKNHKSDWPGIFDSTTGLIFLGTPFRGAEGIGQMEMLEAAYRDYQADEVQPEILKILEPDNEFLQELVDQFSKTRRLVNKAQVACFFELKISNIGGIVGGRDRMRFVVNEISGCLDLSDSTHKFSLSRTHFDMNKFGKPSEEDFETVRDVLKDMIGQSYGLLLARYQCDSSSTVANRSTLSQSVLREVASRVLTNHIHAQRGTNVLPNGTELVLRDYMVEGRTPFGHPMRRASSISDVVHSRRITCVQDSQSPAPLTKEGTQGPGYDHRFMPAGRLLFKANVGFQYNPHQVTLYQSRMSIRKTPSWLWWVGLRASFVRKERIDGDSYCVSIRARVRTRWNKHPFMLVGDFTFDLMTESWRFINRYCLPNIVPVDAEVAFACKHGQLNMVKKLFLSKQASVHDVTPDNYTLLFLAIDGHHVELVRFLLEQGANPNFTFGANQTSPLQWALYLGLYDITRLLLDNGASGDHVSCIGWNPILYLLEGVRRFDGDRPYKILEFLDILNHDKVYIDTETQNLMGYNALQLAAAWYEDGVITRLLNLGASISHFGENPWRYPGNPIWNAINTNNLSAFRALLEYYLDVDAVDRRRLTMLNYTARNGHVEMTELLLQKGAEEIYPEYQADLGEHYNFETWEEALEAGDRDNQSNAGSDYDLDNDEGLEPWTDEKYQMYLATLERFGRIAIRNIDEGEGPAQEIFWTANQYIEDWL